MSRNLLPLILFFGSCAPELIGACQSVPPPRPTPVVAPDSAPDAAPLPAPPLPGPPSCERTCAILEAGHCPEGRPTPHGTRCAEICRTVEGTGYVRAFNACVWAAGDVSAVKACGACK